MRESGSAARITIIGTGMWGTTLAVMLARAGRDVALWAWTAEQDAQFNEERANPSFLPGVRFPDSLFVTHDLERAMAGCHLLLLVVPSQYMRENVRMVAPLVRPGSIVVSAAKGLEVESLKRMTEIVREELPERMAGRACALSGPNIAREIAQEQPATTVVAASDLVVAREVRTLLMTARFRVYSSVDVVGVELGGALKNIIALGAGICDGLGFGDNAKAAFMTRGLAEISRLGTAMGANPLTFAGLAGLGDLVTTCMSAYSRNRNVGLQLAAGRSLNEIQESMLMVAEGVPTTAAARDLARRHNVDMPLTEQVYQVLFAGKSPLETVGELMLREPRDELDIEFKVQRSRFEVPPPPQP